MLTSGQLNKTIPIPLYFQLKELIMQEIKSGNYKSGEIIPTEKEFSDIFKISRTTVRQAITELVQEGWLYRVKSKGTFVSKPKINQSFIQALGSFNDQIEKSGRTPTTELLDFKIITPPEQAALQLKLQPKDKVIFIHRKRFADNEPIVMVKTYLPYKKCSFVLEHDLAKESLYPILAFSQDTHITKIHRVIEAVDATAYDINNLKVRRGKAIQQFISTGHNMFDEPIEYSVARYRGDRNSFEVIIAPNIK
ncbi:MAG: GntR family transcriptional regulator [Anaerocolumna sp.]|jgi:GntR family transcriptional regulator|nr:GntR family transcriptional regulator [Anaerocolumna sp.]